MRPTTPSMMCLTELYQMYKAMDLSDDRYPQEKGHPINDGAPRDNLARVFAMITNIDQNIGQTAG